MGKRGFPDFLTFGFWVRFLSEPAVTCGLGYLRAFALHTSCENKKAALIEIFTLRNVYVDNTCTLRTYIISVYRLQEDLA